MSKTSASSTGKPEVASIFSRQINLPLRTYPMSPVEISQSSRGVYVLEWRRSPMLRKTRRMSENVSWPIFCLSSFSASHARSILEATWRIVRVLLLVPIAGKLSSNRSIEPAPWPLLTVNIDRVSAFLFQINSVRQTFQWCKPVVGNKNLRRFIHLN